MTLLLILVYYGLFCLANRQFGSATKLHFPSSRPLPISILIVMIDWNAFLCINLSAELHAAAAYSA